VIELYNLSPERRLEPRWPGICITAAMERRVAAAPEAVAVQTADMQLTRAGLWARSGRVAAGLLARGVRPGSIVLSQLPTSVDAVILHFAIARIGAVASPVSPMHRGQDLAHMLALAQPALAVVPQEYRGVRFGELHQSVVDELGCPTRVIALRAGRLVDDVGASVRSLPAAPTDPNAPLYVVWTSGTSSGEPKGVVHTHNTGLTAVDRYLERIEATERDSMFVVTPIAHHIGIKAMHMIASHGIRAVLLEAWDPEAALGLLGSAKPTFSSVTPTFLFDLIRAAGTSRAGSLRMTNCSGAPVPPALVERAAEVLPDCRILSAYGASEEGYIASVGPHDPPEMSLHSVGRPLRDTEVRIEAGEVWVRAPSSMAAYLGEERLTAAAFPKPGWRATGDLGRLHPDGALEVVGRLKDQIIRGGLNVPVSQVEDAMLRHPAVVDVALVGVPDPRMGEKGCAFVVCARGEALGLEDVTDFLRRQGIAPTYLPERIECVSALPRTAAGKVQKFELRRIAASLAKPQRPS
jgi:acyl-CoA synthetase (AMP-forming)/AMP-acid ligase II